VLNDGNHLITGAKKMDSRSRKSAKTSGPVSTFTYYIPAPPARKSGYREREFDKIMQGILTSGYEIQQILTESVGGDQNGGLFIIALLRAPNKKVAKLDEHLDIQERFKLSHAHSSPDIILDDEEDV
jgi:hypothetical protein